MDEVCEVSDSLMERYLEGEEISHEEIVGALKEGTNHGKIFPVVCGCATRNLGTSRLLDAIVEDLPSPVKHGSLTVGEIELSPDEAGELFAFVFKTRADPFAGRINLFRVYQGVMRHDTQVMNTTTHHKERIGQLLVFSGKESGHADEFGPGDIGAVAKLKETRAGDWLADRDEPIEMPRLSLPAPVMAFAVEPKSRGDEDKVLSSLRRLQEEDPTVDLHRDAQTGEQIVAGLSQVHVEVIVDRLRDRFGVEVSLKPPRVPYQETIRRPAAAHGRHKKQSGGRGQFGDCQIEIEPIPIAEDDDGFEFVDQIKGGVIPREFIPAVDKGIQETLKAGVLAGYPVVDVKVRLTFGSYHDVDSNENAFRMAGSIAFKEAMRKARPVLLEPMMAVEVETPEEFMGNVMGDLSGRRGLVQGMEDIAGGGGKLVRAEVPLAEMFGYSTSLRSLTQGRATYTMEFKHYAETPTNVSEAIINSKAK
jgi:elongation factor G